MFICTVKINSFYGFPALSTLSLSGSRIAVKSLIWVKYTDNLYYRGFVEAIDFKIHVKFYEREGKYSFGLNDNVGMVPDVTPREVVVSNVYIFYGIHNELWVSIYAVF